MRKDSEKMTKGLFEFAEANGGWFSFSYRFLPGDSIATIKIQHGEVIDIPILLSKHLNNVIKKVRIPREYVDGKGVDEIIKTARVRFIPMDAM